MAAPQKFRSAFNGFNREDVANYLEYMNTKHQNQVNQLTSELEELRSQTDAQLTGNREAQEALEASWQEKIDDLTAQLEASRKTREELEERCAALEAQLAAGTVPEQPEVFRTSEELEAYRRAERIERTARERSELIYYRASGVLGEAVGKVDTTAAELTEMAEQVAEQLTRLQMAVSASKQVLQDASSIMNAIRPNN